MAKRKCVQIFDFGEIKTSVNGNEFRIVKIRDLQNNKTTDYHLFKNSHDIFWRLIQKNIIKDKRIGGEIRTITITEDLLKDVDVKIENCSFSLGDQIDIIVWNINGLETLPDKNKMLWSFKNQLYKFTKKTRIKSK